MPEAKFITDISRNIKSDFPDADNSLRLGSKFVFIPQFTGFGTITKVKWTFDTVGVDPTTFTWLQAGGGDDGTPQAGQHTSSGFDGYKELFPSTKARSFDGIADDYYYFDSSEDPMNDPTDRFIPGTNTLTVGGWFKIDGAASGSNTLWSYGYDADLTSNSTDSCSVVWNADGSFRVRAGGAEVNVTGVAGAAQGDYIHVVLVIPSSGKAQFYVNGQLEHNSIAVGTGHGWVEGYDNSNIPFFLIGSTYSSSTWDLNSRQAYFQGLWDEMFFYNRVLNAADI